MTIDPANGTVKGVAAYSIKARVPGQTQVKLHAAALEIDAVTFDRVSKEFRVFDDSLIIDLADTLTMTSESELAITWQGNSIYGTHKDRFGTMWASLNPKSVRHWLPTYDHPLVSFSMDAEITVPAQFEVISNGLEVSDKVLSAEYKKVTFAADTPVPVTGLNFAVGEFEYMNAQSGIHKVQVLAQKGLISAEQHQELLNIAVSSKRALENTLQFEYPWESLYVVVIEDDYWDVKNDAAGIIYISQNKGSWATQLQRGLAAQWFGQYQRVHKFEKVAIEMELMKNIVLELAGFESTEILNPDQTTSLEAWNIFSGCCDNTNTFYKQVLEESIPELIKQRKGAISFSYYSDYWYEKTGISFEDWDFGDIDEESELQEPEVLYQIDVQHDEVGSKAVVIAHSKTEKNDELQSLWLVSRGFGNADSTEITFTGAFDTLLVEIPNTTEYVTFREASTQLNQIEFGTFPVFFLTAQLGSSNIQHRKLAAKLLKKHIANPDLQLALRDVLEMEQDPGVKAELLITMGAFTNGAAGTEQLFLSELNNESEEIQRAALTALGSYKGDEAVTSSLRSLMARTESEEAFIIAMESFLNIADIEAGIIAAQRLMNTDTTGYKPLQLLERIASDDTTNQSRIFAEEFTSIKHPVHTRLKALNLLLETITDAQYWSALVVELSNDFDPRMRVKVLEGLKFLPETDAANIAEATGLSEFDPRVIVAME